MCIIRLARFIASSSVGESSMDSVGFSLLAAQVAITLTSIFPDSGKGEGRNGPKIAFCRRASQPSSQTGRSSELRACRYWAVITRHKYKTLWLSLFFFLRCKLSGGSPRHLLGVESVQVSRFYFS